MDAERLVTRAIAGALVALGIMSSAGCTTFAGEHLADETDVDEASSSAATTGGGEGGAVPNDPDAYLPLLDAAELCALVGDCPLLGPSILASTGLPLVFVQRDPPYVELSYAACLDWLASPIASGRVGFEAQRELLLGVLPSIGCPVAVGYLPFQALDASRDEQCVGATEPFCTEDGVLIDCAAGLAVDCSSPSFAPLTSCIADAAGARCAIETACPDDPCTNGFAAVCSADGMVTAFDCSTIGLDCIAGRCGTESCAAADIGEQHCSGEVASVCVGGSVGATDCDAAGLTCVDQGPRTRCEDPQAACSPFDPGIDVCAGDVLHTCVAGRPVDVDCAAIGRKCVGAFTLGGFAASGRCAL